MDLNRMLRKCREQQWEVGDLDWTRPPPTMSRDDETAIVQYFTNMAVIERLAAALFDEQARRTDDPVLRAIFETFVKDELRHSHAAQMLADHYDVHRYQVYQPNPALMKVWPHFVEALEHLSPEFANLYITTGELILDVALLRSINDYVDDPMSHEAMRRINQDESRHIAVDYHMVDYYASDAWLSELDRAPVPGWRQRVRAWRAFGMVLFYARPFFAEVFFAPMHRCDPSGRRLKEAFKRIQLLSAKPRVRDRPISRFLLTLQAVHNHPIAGFFLGRLMVRIMGLDPEVIRVLYTEEEFRRATTMTIDELAREALAAKYVGS